MNSENQKIIYLPITVLQAIETIISNHSEKEFYKKHIEKIYYLASFINFGNYDNKNESGWIQVSTKYFRRLLGIRYYNRIISFLLDNQIILYNSDKKYSVNNHCKHYKINPIYYTDGCNVKRIKLNQQIFISKLKNKHNKVKESVMKDNKKEFSIDDYMKMNEIPFDMNSESDKIAKSILTGMQERKNNQSAPEIDTYLTLLKSVNQIEIDYFGMQKWINDNYEDGFNKNKQKIIIEKLKNGNSISLDEYNISNNYRLHTPITALKTELTKFIKGFDAETDISNSQLLFLYCLMIDNNISISDDVKLFGELVSNGNFYEYFLEQWNITYPIKRKEYKRDDIKEKCLSILYCNEFLNNNTNESKLFQKLFPNVFEFILSKKKGKNGASNFAIEQQRNEALFMLPIAKNLIDYGIPILTKHDSFLHCKKYSDFISDAIKNEFKTKYNLNINLKNREWEN